MLYFRTKLPSFLANQGSWDGAKKAFTNVINYYKANGITNFAIYGHCWGGWAGVRAAGQVNDIKAVGVVHAYGVTEEDVQNLAAPGYFLPCSDDPDMVFVLIFTFMFVFIRRSNEASESISMFRCPCIN